MALTTVCSLSEAYTSDAPLVVEDPELVKEKSASISVVEQDDESKIPSPENEERQSTETGEGEGRKDEVRDDGLVNGEGKEGSSQEIPPQSQTDVDDAAGDES